MDSVAQSRFWSLVDGVFVVNLDHRTDRWEQFQSAARGIVPPEKLQRLSASLGKKIPGFDERPWFRGGRRDGTWAGRAGCLQSHRRALLDARARGWRTVLLLEDDVIVAPEFTPALADALADALQSHEWQVCYLGYTEPWGPARRLARLGASGSLQQLHGCTTTHAYLVREAARDWILDRLPDEASVWRWLATHRAIDRWYQRQLAGRFTVTCVSPGVINQSTSASDIATGEASQADVSALSPACCAVAYSCGRIARRGSVALGSVGDTFRGWSRRLTGF